MLFKSTVAAAALALSVVAGPAIAQDTQEGLVNVSVEGVNVQVPVAVAAEVCPNVAANVLAEAATSQEAVCEIDQETAAQHNIGTQGGGQQQGGDQGQGQQQ